MKSMDKISYALGMSMASNLIQSGVKDAKVTDLCAGIRDFLGKKDLKVNPKEANQLLEDYFKKLHDETVEASKKENAGYLIENAKKDGVVTLESGLQYRVIKEGDGTKPTAHSTVKCHYEGRLITGEVFDSSYKRNEPTSFGLDTVIKGWQEGIQLMSTGSTYEFYIPYNLGYGPNGYGPIPPYATLVFKVELLEVK